MFDAHRHLSNEQATKNALYATSKPSEWPRLQHRGLLALGGIGVLPSELPFDATVLYEHLVANPGFLIAEVGLDRRSPDREGQLAFLAEILHIGFELGRSISLHCVREDGLLLSLLRAQRRRLPPLLWHGCTASIETIKEAVGYGVIPSYGPNIYNSRLVGHMQHIKTLPFALETDFTGDEGDYERMFTEHIQAFCSLSGCSEEQLEKHNDEIRAILTHNQTSR
ncbi:hypothetical protein SDC9_76095 [bioreactor metagenome]|jgi:TatD DNase family protein|uniref:Uncharacterized protein n=1 Tax=bioreactor metagenome TaxID=1076179 RepID=A0A644YLU3_9ZZZZ